MSIHFVRLRRAASGHPIGHSAGHARLRRNWLAALCLGSGLAAASLALLASPADGAAVDLGRELEPGGPPTLRVDWITNTESNRSPLDARERAGTDVDVAALFAQAAEVAGRAAVPAGVGR